MNQLIFYFLASHSPNHGASDEFVYEGYPDQESSTNHTVAEVELHPPYLDEEEGQLQMIGAEDYEMEETESEISDTDAEQVRKIEVAKLSTHQNYDSQKKFK